MPKRLGAPIASRELIREGSDKPVRALVWKPFKVRDEEWACQYQIKGFGDEVVRFAHGADAMQALQLSFDGLRTDLNPKQNGIYFIGPGIAEAGFPRSIDFSFGADAYEYLCDVHDKELMPFPDDPQRSTKVRRERVARWKRQSAEAVRKAPRKRGRQ